MIRDNIRTWRKANGIPVGLNFEDDVEQALCQEYPNECIISDPEMPRKREMGMMDVVRGTKMLARIIAARALSAIGMGDSPFVSQEDANSRALICSKCQFNTTFHKPCTGLCPEIRAVVMEVKGSDHHTPFDHDLKSCNICGCYTAAHVWIDLKILLSGLTGMEKKQFSNVQSCWKKEIV
jgi:hypothetical protein